MGLDIVYYESVRLKIAGPSVDDEDGDNEVFLSNMPRLDARSDDLVEGTYTTRGASGGFRAGSYRSYNIWRQQLATMMGTTPQDAWAGLYEGPFLELIDFADNEGFIGPRTSAKLACDFVEWATRAEQFVSSLTADDQDGFLESYREWQNAFQHSAGDGVVCFR